MPHLTTQQIEAGLADVFAAPRDHGRLEMIVLRPAEGRRTTPTSAVCTVAGGVEGDNWSTRGSARTRDGTANPDQQVTMVNARYLDLVAGKKARWPLAGDQLVVDLDLGDDNLTAGDRLRIGEVTVEVTPYPHNGCRKFRDRFGVDAVRVANSPTGRSRHLRGIYVRVITEGTVRVGDQIVAIDGPSPAPRVASGDV